MFLHSSVLKDHHDLDVRLISGDIFISLTSREQARRCFALTSDGAEQHQNEMCWILMNDECAG